MNLLENYIVEIHSESPAIYCLPNNEFITLYQLDITIDCYGVTKRIKTTMAKERWLKAKSDGYYLG